MEACGEGEIECTCPKRGHEFTETGKVCFETDLSDYAPDTAWRD